MTENEAIETLNYFNEQRKALNFRGQSTKPSYFNERQYQKFTNSIEMAIATLEEIRKYRNLGTIEFITDMKSNYVEVLSVLRQYQKLGTVEELKEDKAIAEETAISGKWIPCGERLPETGRNVLVCCGFLNERYIAIAELCEYKGEKSWSIKSSVYAWQQLPEPYQEKKGVNHE